jgi:integrase
MRLTDLQIKKLLAPSKGQKTHFDEGMPGFGIRISQGGSKSFVVVYGLRRRLKTIGRYPDIALADARKVAKKLLGDAAELPSDSPSLPITPYETARERFLVDTETRTKANTVKTYRRLLEKYFRYDKKLRDITRAEVMASVDAIKHAHSERHHAFVAIRTMMNWCVKRGLLDYSPVPRLAFPVSARTRFLSDDELKVVWNRAGEFGDPYGTIVKLLILTGQRKNEIGAIRKVWMHDDEIHYPAGFTKNKRPHQIPLGPLALGLLSSIDSEGDYFFPSNRSPDILFNSWSKSQVAFNKPLQIEPYTLHDLRRTYSSNMARLGVQIHVTEKLLNHVSGAISGVAAIYNRHSYKNEMREAVVTYESHLQKLFEM